tara:strand:- start:6658 stop:7398 length:741 start_codon:yes stop_codon:yes gene_type:complete
MITVFRKIRQKLIADKRASKYLLYATGEILLVVIGILIALQINNWNENRKKESLKKSYETNLINDLKKDTAQLNARLKLNKLLLKDIDSVKTYLDTTSIGMKELYLLLSTSDRRFGLRVLNTYNINTFNILISSGNIDLFSNYFTNELMELNRLQLAEKRVSEGNSNHFFESLTTMRNQYVDVDRLKNERLKKELTKNDDSNRYISLFINALLNQNHTVSRYLELTEKVNTKTKEVLQELENNTNL